jgi:sodium transport system permease protein
MKSIWIVLKKEMVDSLRDYRSWTTVLFWALFGPLLMGGLLIMIGSSVKEDVEKPLHLPVQHQEYAPNLMRFLEQHDVVVEDAPEDPEAAVRDGDVNVVLVIPEDYADNFSSGESATVQLVMDSTRQPAAIDVNRIENLLEGYNTYLGTLRLIVRGVSPQVIEVVTVEDVDVASPQGRATSLIAFLPYFIIFAMFNGAAPIVTDATAGERERQSLEPLLINPVPRRNFVLGKMLAAFPFSLASLGITLVGFGIVFNILPIDEYLGIRIVLNVFTLFLIFLICLPVSLLASAIQMVVASFTNTTKEAGTYLPFIALIPSLPGMALAFFPVKPALWTMLIPTFGQQILINQLMRMEAVDIMNVIISTGMTLVLTVGLTFIAIKLYERERIIARKS